ncbi:DUF4232 domain-containing protein [Streptomyces sp. NPDC097640]|uniref:DUF4232 domain-containing protein n=1 Tax=Streptomyces sp. NPDC097640 TaxID=3157229 RepID=UPI0033171FFE
MLIARPRVRMFAGAGLLITAAMLTTAFQSSGDASGQFGDSSTSAVAAVAVAADQGTGSGASIKTFVAQDTGTQAGVAAHVGYGERGEVGQECGANDISWSTRSETQAGGYILIMAKAKPGITCVLPAALPTVAFGSDGTEAGPAEQAVGEAVTLGKGTTAYAGVNPKTTNENGGKELNSIIVAIGAEDPNPVSLPVDTITVDKPIVTNWHTDAADAVPFEGGTDQ